MLTPESSHNFARLLLCRDINMTRLEGLVFDFGCNLHNYLLNREPREIEFKRVLVDSFHYKNHKACASSYDAANYKKYLPKGFYTTGREQINSKLLQHITANVGNLNRQTRCYDRQNETPTITLQRAIV